MKEPSKKPKKSKTPEVDPEQPLTLTWDLHELPSSQHRAGLAGLVLCVRFLARRKERQGICEIASLDERRLVLSVNRAGMQDVFDDVYAAAVNETLVKAKWQGVEPERVEEVEVKDERGKLKKEKRFVYNKVVPAGLLLDEREPAGKDGGKPWLKLWQDFVWSTLRGVPATRTPYNARAAGSPIDDGGEAWDELATAPTRSVDLSSAYALGTQAQSAENVSISDQARFQFLLHFWSFVASIYVPAKLKRDGKSDFAGHAVAIPDIAILDAFVGAWEKVAGMRSPEVRAYLPREAIIDVAGEAGLDLVRRIEDVVSSMQGSTPTATNLAAVDVFHVEKDGNNIRMRGVARVVPKRRMIDEYARVRRAEYWSPIFRQRRIANVLDEKAWWWSFGQLCATTPEENTIHSKEFRHDARIALKEVEMTEADGNELSLEHLIYKRVQGYVLGKLKHKYDLEWTVVKDDPAKKDDFSKKKEKIAREAFLAVRSRTGGDFVAYFTNTLCSVPQTLPEAKFIEIARALMDPKQVEKVRSLTLLALSAVA